MNKLIIITITSILFLSCMTTDDTNSLALEAFDSDNKTITIKTGSDPVLFGLKKILIEDGWTIEVFNGATITKNEDDVEYEYNSYNTKYLLVSEYSFYNDLIYGEYIASYNFSIINVDTRGEVLMMNGLRNHLKSFLDEFGSIIESNYTN